MEKDFTIILFPHSRIACQISLGTINYVSMLTDIYIVVLARAEWLKIIKVVLILLLCSLFNKARSLGSFLFTRDLKIKPQPHANSRIKL